MRGEILKLQIIIHEDRLAEFYLFSFKKRLKGDTIEIIHLLKGKDKVDISRLFDFNCCAGLEDMNTKLPSLELDEKLHDPFPME